MSVKVTGAVVAVCDRCGERSMPLDPAKVDEWSQRHESKHARGDRRTRLAEQGHRVREVVDWMDMDDSSGHAECSCGWVSGSAKACWTGDMADGHLESVEHVSVALNQTPARESDA